jgi:hypothetical protein
MRSAASLLLVIISASCRGPEAAPESKKSPVTLSMEYPNVVAGGIPSQGTLHVRNESMGNIKALPNFIQALTAGQIGIAVRDASGKLVKQVYPFTGGPPAAPEQKDYLVLKPAEAGKLDFAIRKVVEAYDLKPGRLYFFKLTLKIDGIEAPATLVTPFGYEETRDP